MIQSANLILTFFSARYAMHSPNSFIVQKLLPPARGAVLLLAAILLSALPSAALSPTITDTTRRPLVFVITGESNSGGVGDNADATTAERSPRPNLQIMNLTDGNFAFEDMQLGVNNLRDHYRLEKFYETRHGLELGLANAVDADAFADRKPVYLIKTGHGGSRVLQWSEGNELEFWKKFVQRIDAAKRQLPDQPQWVVWYSLGINDALDGAPIESWTENVQMHLKRIKQQLPGVVIVMTQFQSMGYAETNAAIAEIANADASVLAVDSTATTLGDKNHWDYAGLKTMAARMIEATQQLLETAAKPPETSTPNAPQ